MSEPQNALASGGENKHANVIRKLYRNKNCPICAQRDAFMLMNANDPESSAINVEKHKFSVFVMACVNCGFIRQHFVPAFASFDSSVEDKVNAGTR